jgi:hypothetical protein
VHHDRIPFRCVWRTYTLNTLLSDGRFDLHTIAPGCEFAGRRDVKSKPTPDAATPLPPATQHIAERWAVVA